MLKARGRDDREAEMEVFQCPVCELKFHYPSELDDHMAAEHPGFRWEPRSVEDSLLGATHRPRHLSPKYPPDYKTEPPPMYRTRERRGGTSSAEPVEEAHPAWTYSEPWMKRAACRGMDTTLFFGSNDGETEEQREAREREAKAICNECPVATDCLEFALTTKQKYGIWGGLNERERTSELRRRVRATRAS